VKYNGELYGTELLEKMIDSPFLRLSEFIKDLNKKLNINGCIRLENRKEFESVEELDLLYGLSNIEEEKAYILKIFEIVR
jgi:hypothetical protein